MTIVSILLALIAVSFLIFIHELGHYFVARFVGMNVEVFSIGFGRPILRWRRKGVQWQIGILPFGGFVKISGMDSQKGKEIHEIPGGFFSKSPWARIQVALAGPVANMLLALICFGLLWGFGGRLKPFSEFTQIIGYVDPNSELYLRGVEAGDEISSIDGTPYRSYKDLLYTMISQKPSVNIAGYHVNYRDLSRVAYQYQLQFYPDPLRDNGEFKTVGILAPASYLQFSEAPSAASPLAPFHIHPRDRLVWADGELLFSMMQLSAILNDDRALLAIEREGSFHLVKVPRILVRDLDLLPGQRNELDDWHFEAKLPGKVQMLAFIPYQVSPKLEVKRPLAYLNQNVEQDSFRGVVDPVKELDQPLKVGDRILSVDGQVVQTPYEFLKALQKRMISIIVQDQAKDPAVVRWKEADDAFLKSVQWNDVRAMETFLTQKESRRVGNLRLLRSIEPVRLGDLALETGLSQKLQDLKWQAKNQKEEQKKQMALSGLAAMENRKVLGALLEDQKVLYNPSPFSLFGSVMGEMAKTIQSIVTGAVSPKWLSGPIGVVQVVHHGITDSFKEALFWLGAISLNLGLFNLLPIPVLDGGHICFSVYEWASGRKMNAKTMERLVIPFVVMLILLFAYVTFQDLSRLFH